MFWRLLSYQVKRNSMTKIIAEIASCHNGDVELAKAHVKAAKDAHVDMVKFQSWRAGYVDPADPDKKRYEKYEFTDDMHREVKAYCDELGIEFFSTVTRVERIPFLKELGLKKVKIASVSLSNTELLKAAVENFEEVIASTAMQDTETITEALKILRPTDTIMHCVANYPCKLEDANLQKITWLKSLHPSVGYSDHTLGFQAPTVAMAMGVKYIEKHMTLSTYLPQIPHQMYEGGPYITTHQVANLPEILHVMSNIRNDIETIIGKNLFPVNEVEQKIKQRYEGRY